MLWTLQAKYLLPKLTQASYYQNQRTTIWIKNIGNKRKLEYKKKRKNTYIFHKKWKNEIAVQIIQAIRHTLATIPWLIQASVANSSFCSVSVISFISFITGFLARLISPTRECGWVPQH